MYFMVNWGALSFISSDNSFDIVGAAVADGNWHHGVFAYNYTSGNWSLYVDGSLDTNQTATTGVDIPIWNSLGAQAGGNYSMVGNLSNIAYFSSELSAANVLTIYNNGRPGDLTDLSPVSWWKMGQEAFCPDYTASPNVWTIPDQTGSNDGTSAGNPDLVGEAPQSFANGLSVSMDIDDRIGESGFSDNNALSYNMDSEARKADVPA